MNERDLCVGIKVKVGKHLKLRSFTCVVSDLDLSIPSSCVVVRELVLPIAILFSGGALATYVK